jgi:hypothetical protein
VRVLESPPDQPFVPTIRAEEIAYQLYLRAMKNDAAAVTALRTILERVDGAVPQQIALADPRTPFERYLADRRQGEAGRGTVWLSPPRPNPTGP